MIAETELKLHGLSTEEYQRITEILGRDPNNVELGMYGAMWSEHCSYKNSKRVLKRFPTTGKRVIQGPGENAGIVDIGDNLVAVLKIESHNHPSAVEPFQGAATGVGGIIRDIFAMGARPLALLDSLRFGELDEPRVKYLFSGVVSGISHYGNCVGIPTVGGEVYFDSCYRDNPLVNVMCVGVANKKDIKLAKAVGVGNSVMLVGSSTGRDGIHGASFASEELSEDSESKRPSVQVGDPFMEKLLIEACLEASKKDFVLGVQDLGAAGLTSACCEAAARAGTGMDIDISLVPQREENMSPYEIMLSESQERMLLIVKRGYEEEVSKIFAKWDLHAVKIGTVTNDGMITVRKEGVKVAQVPAKSLTEGVPEVKRESSQPSYLKKTAVSVNTGINENPERIFLKLLGSPNLSSKRWVFEQYDHRVGTNTVVKPGSDAAVIRIKGTSKGIALTTDCNSLYCYLDPLEGGKQAVAEAARNIVVTGAEPIAITDCLNFGNPEDPEIFYQVEQCVEGISQAAEFLGIPVVSGNVSFYNESPQRTIFPTPVIGMIGLLENINERCETGFKDNGDIVVLLGEVQGSTEASEYLRYIHDVKAGKPPKINLLQEKKIQQLCLRAVREGVVKSAHDVSLGGLAVALAECCVIGKKGFKGNINCKNLDAVLFGESPSRIVVSVSPKNVETLKLLAEQMQIKITVIGTVCESRMTLTFNSSVVIDLPLDEVIDVYENSLERRISAQ